MKKTGMKRREFVGTLAATAAMLEPTALALSKPHKPKKGPTMKVGLYSITFLGIWYQGRGLTIEEVIERAKRYGYDGVELDGKRPHANPLDLPTSRCRELRRIADGEGIEVFGVAANNDFSSPIPEHRECQVAYVRDLVRAAADLGAPIVRMFFAWPGVTKYSGKIAQYDIAQRIWQHTHEPFTEEETWDWCREGLVECARYAADAGVTLALQNHKPIINHYRDMLDLIAEVDSHPFQEDFLLEEFLSICVVAGHVVGVASACAGLRPVGINDDCDIGVHVEQVHDDIFLAEDVTKGNQGIATEAILGEIQRVEFLRAGKIVVVDADDIRRLNHFFPVAPHHGDILDSHLIQYLCEPMEQGHTADREHGLGTILGQTAEFFAPRGGKDHGVYALALLREIQSFRIP